MTEISGTCDDRFASMRDLLARSIDDGDDLGASVAVNVDGEPVVDIWGGWCDVERTTPWQADTITNVWSTTKTMTAISALVLASQGELDLDQRVAHYWPEFAAEGKGDIAVRMLLAHTSGVSGWAQPVTADDVYDWDRSTAMLAAQAPWWEPGTASGYHMINYGHLIGEVIRRITGLRLGEYFAAHVAEPLGADFHIGLPAAHDHRVAAIVPPPGAGTVLAGVAMDRDSPMYRTISGPTIGADTANTTAWRRADIGGGNGHGNARSVARVQSALSTWGDVGDGELLRPEVCARVFEQQSDNTDLVVGVPFRFGIGYGLRSSITPHIPDGRVCWWGGWGGSLCINDLDRRVTFAYMMNKMGPGNGGDLRAYRLAVALYEALDSHTP
jgi:CubicO group peptidase (beta-lactamase class C family)